MTARAKVTFSSGLTRRYETEPFILYPLPFTLFAFSPYPPFPSWLRVLTCSLLICLVGGACQHTEPPPKPYLAFVANQGSNTVGAVDLAAFHVVAQIPVAPQPRQLVLRPGSRELYVVSESGTLTIIRFPELRVFKTIPLGGAAQGLAFSPDGRSFYLTVTRSGSSEIVFGDGERGRVPPDGSSVRIADRAARAQGADRGLSLLAGVGSLVLTPDGKTLIVTDATHNRLVFVSVESKKIVGAVDVGKGPGAMAVLPNGSKVFVADTREEKISAADVASHQILSHIEISSRPGALLLKPDGGELFVLSTQGIATIVDAFHDNVEQTFPTGRGTATAVIRRDQSVLYLANAGDGSVTCLDVENRVVLNSTHVGTEPRALALTPDERFLVVADYAASSLAVLRADPRSRDRKGKVWMDPMRSLLITTVPVGAGPIDVVVPDWQR
jgi:YVTN family beta-propeller protein